MKDLEMNNPSEIHVCIEVKGQASVSKTGKEKRKMEFWNVPQILFLIKPILTKKSIYLLGQNLIQRQKNPKKTEYNIHEPQDNVLEQNV